MKLTLCRHGYIVDEKGKRFEIRGNEERLIAAWNAYNPQQTEQDKHKKADFKHFIGAFINLSKRSNK